MVAIKTVALLALLGVVAGTSQLRKPTYDAQVNDVKAMMEGVRAQTEGSSAPVAAPVASVLAKTAELSPGEHFLGEHKLDDDLMDKADQVASIMKHAAQEEDPTVTKPESSKASLAVKVSVTESESQRAARFFATHGMMKIGSMLGDELSAEAKGRAVEEHSVTQTKTVASAPSARLDILEDDDDEAYKKQWAAVDALRNRRH